MVDDPAHHLEEFASSGADSVTFHVEAAADAAGRRGRGARPRARRSGVAFNPGTSPADAAEAAADAEADIVLCMSIDPGLLGPGVHARGDLDGSRELAALVDVPIQVDGGVGEDERRAPCALPARRCSSPGARSSPMPIPPPPTGGLQPLAA